MTQATLAILHVLAPADVGGLERVVEALASGHQARGHRVAVAAVFAPGRAEPPLLASLRRSGVDVRPVALAGRSYLRERASIARLCRDMHPAVVHTHGYRPDVLDAGVARRLGVAVVTTVHGFTGGGWRNRLYERLQVRAYRRFDAVVAVSRPMAAQLALAGVPGDRLHCIANAWAGTTPVLSRDEARRILGLPASGFVIGWVGRFSAEKGPEVLVRAMPWLSDLPVTAAMVGDGPARAAAQADAARLDVADRIAFPGPVPDAAGLLPAFDVFALSSRTEGTPIVLFEAMAAGVPLVAAKVGGVPDVVGDAEALLVPSGDPRALAAAVRSVAAEPAAAAARAAAARRRLETAFAADQWLDRYEALYRAVRRTPAARLVDPPAR